MDAFRISLPDLVIIVCDFLGDTRTVVGICSLIVDVSYVCVIAKLSHSCSLLPSSWNLTCLWSGSDSISMLLAGVA